MNCAHPVHGQVCAWSNPGRRAPAEAVEGGATDEAPSSCGRCMCPMTCVISRVICISIEELGADELVVAPCRAVA